MKTLRRHARTARRHPSLLRLRLMRRTRLLLLAAILIIVGAVTSSYLSQLDRLRKEAPPHPVPLPRDISADLDNWSYAKTIGSNTKVEIRAKDIKQIKEPSVVQLKDVELRIYDERKKQHDRIRSALATFDTAEGRLFSEGKVDIDMGINEKGEHVGRLLSIHTSGVTFDSNTGKASTDRFASFEFDQGEGHSDGASYDPQTGRLDLESNAAVTWRGATAGDAPPMLIEAGEAVYREGEKTVGLGPWARLTRGPAVIESGAATVRLNEAGGIEDVEAVSAKGADEQDGRKLTYKAEELTVNFDSDGLVSKVVGKKNAELRSLTSTSETTVTGGVIEMHFDTATGESLLANATSNGNTVVTSKPLPVKGAPPASTRILRSEVVELVMHKDGKSIDMVHTHTPGQLDLLPNAPGQKKRHLDAERITLEYGPANQLKRFFATSVRTRTESAAAGNRGPQPPATTSSKGMDALFDPDTGEMTKLRQWDDFRYQQGERQATAATAVIDYPKDLMTLTTNARVWDDTGATSADRIEIRQSNGDATAIGHVSSTRLPDTKSKPSAGLISTRQPLRARAGKMVVTDGDTRIRYEGSADVWSGANRIEAPLIEIDRLAGTLRAEGGVVTRLVENSSADDAGARQDAAKPHAGPPRAATFTFVSARTMNYSDVEKMADYQTDVVLTRDELEVKAHELRAWFRDNGGKQATDSGGESSLDRVFAEGDVHIVKKSPGRTRTGHSELAEYYLDSEKLVLKGGNPVVTDSDQGSTAGNLVVWYARDGRLLVDNSGSGPAISRIRER